MANDLDELRRLKGLQARILGELGRRDADARAQRHADDMTQLLQLGRMLITLVKETRDERDALAAELAESRTPAAPPADPVDDLAARLAAALRSHGGPAPEPAREIKPSFRSTARRAPIRVDRRALGGSYAPPAATDRMAWALRS